MTDLTICAKCKHYAPPFYCWHKSSEDPEIDYVTGEHPWRTPAGCYEKNHGQCLDYEFTPPVPWFTAIGDLPRKHWWQK